MRSRWCEAGAGFAGYFEGGGVGRLELRVADFHARTRAVVWADGVAFEVCMTSAIIFQIVVSYFYIN